MYFEIITTTLNLIKGGKFDLELYYEALRGSRGIPFSWQSIWGAKVPHLCNLGAFTLDGLSKKTKMFGCLH